MTAALDVWGTYPPGTVLGPWPIDLGDLALDRVDAEGGEWSVTAFSGRGSAPSAAEVTQRVNGHGATVGGRWWAAKPYTIDLAYSGPNADARWRAQQKLLGSIGLCDVTLTVHEEVSWTTTVMLNGEVTIDPINTYAFTAQVPLIAPDPFRYSVDATTLVTTLPTQTGGLKWDLTTGGPVNALWPAKWTGGPATGAFTVDNQGTFTTYPTFKVYGPLNDFILANPATGEQLSIDLAGMSAPLAAGEWIDLDMGLQRVLFMGTQSRRSGVRGTFFGLAPGVSTVLFSSTTFNTTARAELTYRSVWQ